jgi:hypothetical protein
MYGLLDTLAIGLMRWHAIGKLHPKIEGEATIVPKDGNVCVLQYCFAGMCEDVHDS